MSEPVATERPCPECGSPVAATTGYPAWCERCGWNLEPPPVRDMPRGRFARLAERAGRRSGEQMARELLQAGTLEPRWTPAKVAAYAIALAVHLLSLALVVGAQAARAAGTPAVVALHERLLLASQFELTVQRAAQADDAEALFARLHDALESLPEHERERRRRVARLEHTRLDDTHPPTGMRISLLEGREPLPPAVTLNSAWSARIDDELRPLEREIARELLDAHRSSLYYG